jgi:hypothetical protein
MASIDDPVLLTPPDAAEVHQIGRGVVSAVSAADGPAGLTAVQAMVIETIFHAMTGHDIDVTTMEPMTAAEFAVALSHRNQIFRTRIVQIMLLSAFVVRPLPPQVAHRLREYAAALDVRDEMIDIAEAYAGGSFELASADFARNGYLSSIGAERLAVLHTSTLDQSWGQVTDDVALAARWESLHTLPVGTLGRGVADFYTDRGFAFPGRPGSAPPLLAQHDWVHVLAGYGTALENEIEVFGFIARANDDPRAFSLLAMVISLFETGYLAAGAGLFEADAGHLRTRAMAARLADAMRRGALTQGSHDFLDVDWFDLADRPVEVVRTEIGLVGKDPAAIADGSAGPWQRGGISEFQLRSARAAADADGREYVPWSPDPARS